MPEAPEVTPSASAHKLTTVSKHICFATSYMATTKNMSHCSWSRVHCIAGRQGCSVFGSLSRHERTSECNAIVVRRMGWGDGRGRRRFRLRVRGNVARRSRPSRLVKRSRWVGLLPVGLTHVELHGHRPVRLIALSTGLS